MQSTGNGTWNRREFLKATASGLALTALGGLPLAAAEAVAGKNRKPNILVIMSDEHNASVLGCYGNSIIRTPNLDNLAQRGISFRSCYCNSPLCVPSRLAFTSGKYISRVGAWNNDCWLPSPDYPSLPRILNAAGYESFLCGKMHYDNTRRYGFTEIGGNMNRSTKDGRGKRRNPDDLTQKKLSGRFGGFHTGDDGPIEAHDVNVTAGVLDFLQHRKADDKPFFLTAGYLAPHFPLVVPERYWKAYEGRIPMPVIPPGHLESQPLNYKELRAGFQVNNVPDHVVRKSRELYFGLTQWVDHEIGKVLTTLAQSAAADNTVILYTADHGENMGEHGMWWKNCMYENAARIPLIVSWPSRWKGGQYRDGACSMVDVVKTIGEIGGASAPHDWNGDSLCAWMDDPAAQWKDTAVSEYYAHNIASGYAMIRQGSHKYVYHTPADARHPAQRELYDLSTDPGEFKNLAGDASQADRVSHMHEALIAEIGENPNVTELRCRADYAKGYGRRGTKEEQKPSMD